VFVTSAGQGLFFLVGALHLTSGCFRGKQIYLGPVYPRWTGWFGGSFVSNAPIYQFRSGFFSDLITDGVEQVCPPAHRAKSGLYLYLTGSMTVREQLCALVDHAQIHPTRSGFCSNA
jgi:hypothetical protein